LIKKLLGLLAVAVLVASMAGQAGADEITLDGRVFWSPASDLEKSVIDDLFIQGQVIEHSQRRTVVGQSPDEREYVERTQRQSVVGQSSPRYNPEMPAQWSLRLGYLMVGDAKDETPTDVPTLGLSARILLPPDGLHMLELSIDSTIDRMQLDETVGTMDDFYQGYFDIVVSFMGSFGARQGIDSPLYWGFGVGYCKELARVNYTEAARALGYPGGSDAFNESAVLVGKVGWDSGRQTYIELQFKKITDSERNLDQLWNLVVGLYF